MNHSPSCFFQRNFSLTLAKLMPPPETARLIVTTAEWLPSSSFTSTMPEVGDPCLPRP